MDALREGRDPALTSEATGLPQRKKAPRVFSTKRPYDKETFHEK
jgi:hypothetical protein